MGLRFRRSIKLLPGVRLNLGGKRGPSVTVGRRCASISSVPSGTYMNHGIPGTGLSYRERLDAPRRASGYESRNTISPDAFRLLLWIVAIAAGIIIGAILS